MEIFGHFIEKMPDNSEHLTIVFSPTSVPLKQRWRNNGLSADFIADYLQTFFVGNTVNHGEQCISQEIKQTAKYIANELLENAMKFSEQSVHYPTRISLYLSKEQLIFYVTNTVNAQSAENFKQLIKTILDSSDPQSLYLSKMEANALDESEHARSGLGFLSMMCDYSTQLSWKFETIDEPTVMQVTTMAILTI